MSSMKCDSLGIKCLDMKCDKRYDCIALYGMSYTYIIHIGAIVVTDL